MSLLSPLYTAVNTLVGRLSASRAAALDRLDATVSTRAPADTAVSTAHATPARLASLDNLDTNIASRAPAATALSSTVWTGTKAGYLDAAISSVAGAIKSIQSGKVDTSTLSSGSDDELKYLNVTLTAVTTAKCLVLLQVFAGSSPSPADALPMARQASFTAPASGYNVAPARAYLTSTTNLRIYTGLTASYVALSGRWWVVEFK